MKHTSRILMGALALMLVLGSVGCGAPSAESLDSSASGATAQQVASGETTSQTDVPEETPGVIWLVPSEAECPAASRDDVPLVMTVENVTPSQATLVLRAKDGSEFGVGYAPAYRISRYTESGWIAVGPGRAFPEPYYLVSARLEHRNTVELVAGGASLTTGYYRVEKDYSTTVNGETVAATYYAYFEIGDSPVLAIPSDPVTSLENVPIEHRPTVSDEAKSEDFLLTATYAVPNGVTVSIAAKNGADKMSLNMSWNPIFEQYVAGKWVRIAGQEAIQTDLGSMHAAMPIVRSFAMRVFPEAGVYRCVMLLGLESAAEYYAYFEVPEITLTMPTEAECPAADTANPPLTVKAKDVDNLGLTLVLQSRSGEKVGFSYCCGYSLSCHINGGWEPVAMYDGAFKAVAIYGYADPETEIGGSFAGHHDPLPEGYYRYARKFDSVTYYVYFRICP